MQRVNLALLPKVEYGHAWFTLDAEVADRVRKLQRAAERIQNSIKFMWFSDSGDETLHCGAEEAGRLREGLLRAALAELVSVEEVLDIDLADNSHSSVDPIVRKLVDLRNKMLSHRDLKFILPAKSSKILKLLSSDEIDHVLDLARNIINRYSSLFRSSVYSTQIIGHDDYLSVLNAVREHWVRHEQEIENEIKALGDRKLSASQSGAI